MRMRWLAACFVAAVAIAPALATTVIPMSVEQMTRAATNVVHARAVTSWSEWDARHETIYTYTRFAVLGQWKGEAPLTLTVKQPGGVRDGIQIKVAGVRSFADNEETVLFLRPSMAADGTMVVVGLMQGNFRVLRGASGAATVANGVRDVLSYSPAERAVGTYRGGSMPLAELERRVRKAVGR